MWWRWRCGVRRLAGRAHVAAVSNTELVLVERVINPTERYAQQVVLKQPNPPREVDLWLLFRTQLTLRKWYQIGVLVALIVLMEYLRIVQWQGEIWTIRYYLFYLLVIPGWPLIIYLEFVQPWFRWRRAICDGWYRVAKVTEVKQPVWYYKQKVSGRWLIEIDDVMYDLPFHFNAHNSSPWIFALSVGSHVHVLFHPTKPDVLVAFGIVDDHSSNSTEANQIHLLAKLLDAAPPSDVE
jgi:hypothetical protein